mmetsp:Transcript_9228/g.19058  ORF Transcript_9228/g.19058 Transcript_9228/m.19058 type:complete len:457 (-) Transcript_9228:163-1533(-)|eukprot:CAMPEP_0118926814 /NCGR_PEP_ID=MMETSP1169-20130426/4432_1 /TAXON_ID=36882 /ORGANISM="Pyramimonas obovata, Strain CCMP722" /LENGTH=456 /DNA_ID=CAMNT_0006868447 /DNA_START=85 /DNA_END=1455 /DNA_ORIENTATION=-
MGRRRAGKKKANQEEGGEAEGAECAQKSGFRLNDEDTDTLPTFATHPSDPVVAMAFGPSVRVYDARSSKGVELVEEKEALKHTAALRCLAFAQSGHLMASAGDDKLVKVWDTKTWKCLRSWLSPKKISAVQFSPKGDWVFFANKFGEVLAASCSAAELEKEVTELKPGEGSNLVLGHCCSIITDILIPSDGRHIITCDRDEKIRTSRMPTDPSDGSHEIAAYCLGHRSFVTCLAHVKSPGGEQLLLSGGGDGTVRLWQPELGTLLATFEVSTAASGEEEENESATVVAVAASPSGSIAVAVQGYPDVLLLKVTEEKTLGLVQRTLMTPAAHISHLGFSAEGQLWATALAPPSDQEGGADPAAAGRTPGTASLAVASLAQDGTLSPNQEAPPAQLAEAIQVAPARLEVGDSDPAQRVYTNRSTELGAVIPVKGLLKRKISEQERESRKANRNDKKPF